MTGIYGGLTLTLAWLVVRRQLGAVRLGGWVIGSILGCFFLSMVVDGIHSTLTEMRLPHPYTSTNLGRLITGLYSGVTSAVGMAWILANAVRWQDAARKSALVQSPTDLVVPLVGCALLGFVVVNERGWSY